MDDEWECPRCDFASTSYGGYARHHGSQHKGVEPDHALADYMGETLVKWYLDHQMSVNEISNHLSIGREAVTDALRAMDVELRGRSEAEVVKNAKKTAEERRKQTEKARDALPDGGGLAIAWEEQYDAMKATTSTNGALGTENRERNGMEGVTGQDHHNWRGGKSIYDAVKRQLAREESWESVRTRVRESQDHQCAMCGEKPRDRGLDVHHIVPILVGGTNDDELLMGLCKSCHRRSEWYTRSLLEPVLVDG